MNNATYTALVLMVTGASVLAMAGDVPAETGAAGAGPGTPGMEGGRTGPAVDTDKEPGANRDNRLSGDSPDSAHRSSEGMGMPQVPAGIGERGTGQTQSTLERSGVGQNRNAPGMASDRPGGIEERGTGQTQNTLERSENQQSGIPQAMAPLPPNE